eukprot:7380064-Prymnesium_polylepis.1
MAAHPPKPKRHTARPPAAGRRWAADVRAQSRARARRAPRPTSSPPRTATASPAAVARRGAHVSHTTTANIYKKHTHGSVANECYCPRAKHTL